jgi:HK97 family phage portal protein
MNVSSFLPNWFKASLPQFLQTKLSTMSVRGGYSLNQDIKDLAESGYCLNTSTYSSVRKVINSVLQMKLYTAIAGTEGKEEAEEKIDTESDLYKLIQYPDKGLCQSDWLEMFIGFYEVLGELFIYAMATEEGMNKGKPVRLVILTRLEVEVFTENIAIGKQITGYQLKNNPNVKLDATNFMHFKSFNPLDRTKGFSAINACGYSIDIDNSAKKWNVNLLLNGVNPTGIFTTDNDLTKEQFERLKDQINNEGGVDNAGKNKLIEGGLKFTQTGLSPKDADFTFAQKTSKREIASAFNVPPQLIGDTESQTFANYTQAVLSLHNDTAYPLLKNIVDALNRFLSPKFDNRYEICIDTSGVEALQEQKKSEWSKIDASNELTVNEKRALKGFEEIPNGDVIIIGGKTLEQIIEGIQVPNFNDNVKSIRKMERKAKYIDCQIKAMTRNEDKAIDEAKAVINKYFDFQLNEIEEKAKTLSTVDQYDEMIKGIIIKTTPALKEVYNIIYKDIGFEYALKARASAKKDFFDFIKIETKETPKEINLLKAFKTEYGQYVDKYFKQIKIDEILINVDKETQKMLQNIIDTVITEQTKEGASIGDITRGIKDMYGESMTTYRAERIARTESLRAVSFASLESQKKVAPLSKKQWHSGHDDRVRDGSNSPFDHKSVDFVNGEIELNYAFNVSGERLDFPRDSSHGASGGNVINCRCAISYHDSSLDEYFE